MVTCDSIDFFTTRPQAIIVDITELGTIKLQLEVIWKWVQLHLQNAGAKLGEIVFQAFWGVSPSSAQHHSSLCLQSRCSIDSSCASFPTTPPASVPQLWPGRTSPRAERTGPTSVARLVLCVVTANPRTKALGFYLGYCFCPESISVLVSQGAHIYNTQRRNLKKMKCSWKQQLLSTTIRRRLRFRVITTVTRAKTSFPMTLS